MQYIANMTHFLSKIQDFLWGPKKKTLHLKTCDKPLPYRIRTMKTKIIEHGKKSLSY